MPFQVPGAQPPQDMQPNPAPQQQQQKPEYRPAQTSGMQRGGDAYGQQSRQPNPMQYGRQPQRAAQQYQQRGYGRSQSMYGQPQRQMPQPQARQMPMYGGGRNVQERQYQPPMPAMQPPMQPEYQQKPIYSQQSLPQEPASAMGGYFDDEQTYYKGGY